jgi:hypothetical protein
VTSPGRQNPLPGGSSIRGIVVLVVAVVIGVFLLAKGGSSGTIGRSTSNKTTTTVTSPALTTTTPTTVTPSTNAPASVTVAVANGTGGRNTHASSQTKSKLAPAGYSQVTILNDLASSVQSSAVYFTKPTAQGDAFAVAQVLGLSSSAVQSATGAKLPPGSGDAQVVVVIGVDQTTGGAGASSTSAAPGSGSSTP